MPTKVLLVQIHASPYAAEPLPSLGLGYIAAYLRKHLPDIEISIVSDSTAEEHINIFQPDIVGIGSYSAPFEKCISISRFAAERHIPVVVGGVHVSALPTSLDYSMGVGVLGEGERTFLELVQRKEQGCWGPEMWSTVPGIVFRDASDKMVFTATRSLSPLDELPLPARDLLPTGPKDIAHLLTSRGCPYRCRFCASAHFWKGVRFFSPEYVAREVEHILSTQQPYWLFFYDDLFTINPARLKRIVELLDRQGLPSNLQCMVNVRSDVVNRRIASMLKRMQVSLAFVGMESVQLAYSLGSR